jgi:hypothetical protein
MKRIPKDLADKMVEEVLTKISKNWSVSSQFAEESMNIMHNSIDNAVFTGILISKANPSFFDENEKKMKLSILSAMQFVISNTNADYVFHKDLMKHFSKDDESVCLKSTQLDFALNQFVNAFFEYERLKKQYPELMRIM